MLWQLNGQIKVMSTTFVIHVPSPLDGEGEDIRVAFRSNGIRWKNPIARLLPDDTKVEALDNSPQGIYTIGDIKKEIKAQDSRPKNMNK
jgi:hypothetical protein